MKVLGTLSKIEMLKSKIEMLKSKKDILKLKCLQTPRRELFMMK